MISRCAKRSEGTINLSDTTVVIVSVVLVTLASEAFRTTMLAPEGKVTNKVPSQEYFQPFKLSPSVAIQMVARCHWSR